MENEEDNYSTVANAGETAKKKDKILKLRKKLGKKNEILNEMDILEMKLIAQRKCLSKIKKIASKVSKNIKDIQEKVDKNESVKQEPELKKIKRDIASCSQITKQLKSFVAKERAINNQKISDIGSTKNNVTSFINELISDYNSLLKDTFIFSSENGKSNQNNNNEDGNSNEKISHALFDLYEYTKTKSIQDLIKLSKKKNQNGEEPNKKRKRKKS
jgi:hypothetical protein